MVVSDFGTHAFEDSASVSGLNVTTAGREGTEDSPREVDAADRALDEAEAPGGLVKKDKMVMRQTIERNDGISKRQLATTD